MPGFGWAACSPLAADPCTAGWFLPQRVRFPAADEKMDEAQAVEPSEATTDEPR
jgi:hypothetical protein